MPEKMSVLHTKGVPDPSNLKFALRLLREQASILKALKASYHHHSMTDDDRINMIDDSHRKALDAACYIEETTE